LREGEVVLFRGALKPNAFASDILPSLISEKRLEYLH
jgi:hypothetical protein